MSVQFDGDPDNYLTRTASMPDYNSAFTWAGWVKPEFEFGFESYFYVGTDDDSDYFGQLLGAFYLEVYLNGSQGNDDGTAFSVDTWYHLAMVREDNENLRLYLNGSADAAVLGVSVSGRTAPSLMHIGQWGTALDGPFIGEVEDVRLWTSALTGGQLLTESQSQTPVITSGLWASWPLLVHTDVNDSSGNGRHWTVQGTLTTGSDSPTYPSSGFPYPVHRRHGGPLHFGRG